ncbi:undecaprenyldiphospho-muramoylpentapeptide beta-N-acetylglucosaminyltransferase [Allosalinactinospora lopnorensis]|uniref:undecaprenyldiphospho-muramoylpentapeptide beta-N-acetylglucosaminyltransferase n=1 Tax=Allosalinactinospora lopnorensis TaxID=1352348 RepID=UPI000623E9B7|nr:undecaprenyldiphospho-muramoylpentapeptide beta-N-acetylglucosaminyltransferase [Allosalinactinospora lopnorensis]
MRVALAGGGTAGHIEPALSLADALRRIDPETRIVCLGTERGLETRLVPMRGYELGQIPAVPLPRKLTPKLLSVPGKLANAISAAGEQLDRISADVLVGFGGYVATPGYLAARRRRTPIVVHEANPLPGLANRLGARLTPHVFTGHPHTDIRNGRYVGIPLREQISRLDRLALGDKARAHFGLRPELPTLLIFGGSQGAQAVNEAAFEAADQFRSASVQVLHVVGPKNADEPEDRTRDGVPYVIVPYVDRMDLAYAAADVAMCRSGAMTCAELTAVGLPGAFVPLPIGNGEQRLNAEPIVQAGGGLMVDNSELTSRWIAEQLIPLLTDTDRVVAMSEAAAKMGRRAADMELAREVLAIARGDQPTPEVPVDEAEDDGEVYLDDGKDAR